MKDAMQNLLHDLLAQWQRMQKANILQDAEDSASLFEYKFYQFIESFRKWFATVEGMTSLEDALKHPDIDAIVQQLPAPLYLPFENELDLMIEGITQEADEKYD